MQCSFLWRISLFIPTQYWLWWKPLMKRGVCAAEDSPPTGGSNFRQLWLFTLAPAPSPRPPAPPPRRNNSPMHPERQRKRKLSNTNTIKLSGNLIGCWGGTPWPSYFEAIMRVIIPSWARRKGPVWVNVRIRAPTRVCLRVVFLVRRGPISKQHSALTKPQRYPPEYGLEQICEKFSSLNQAKVQTLSLWALGRYKTCMVLFIRLPGPQPFTVWNICLRLIKGISFSGTNKKLVNAAQRELWFNKRRCYRFFLRELF